MASSKSAMKTLAPELRALIIILRSTGPVISTRRSWRSGGAGATRQSPSRIGRVSARKLGVGAAVEVLLEPDAARQQVAAGRVEAAVEVGDEGERIGGQHLVEALAGGAEDADAGAGLGAHRPAPGDGRCSVALSNARTGSVIGDLL